SADIQLAARNTEGAFIRILPEDEEEDYKEYPIPNAFEHSVVDGKLVTIPLSAGAD
ncbi:hypothetical protein KIPB_007980, partial [Kipferlia bialata]